MARPKGQAAMGAAELRSYIDYLGIGQRDVARMLGVNDRTVRSWLQHRDPVLQETAIKVNKWFVDFEAATASAAANMEKALSANQRIVVVICRTDEEQWAFDPSTRPYPARFMRHVTMAAIHRLVLKGLPGVVNVVYRDEVDEVQAIVGNSPL